MHTCKTIIQVSDLCIFQWYFLSGSIELKSLFRCDHFVQIKLSPKCVHSTADIPWVITVFEVINRINPSQHERKVPVLLREYQ